MKKREINTETKKFIARYKLFEEDYVQQLQLQHRLNLVKKFELKKGDYILEIGCGQGETTAVLADAVGENGKVIGIDIGSKNYGLPLTLQQATNHIKESTLGERIIFALETDFKTFEIDKKFDGVVLSHSSWYFQKPEDLLLYLKKIRKYSKRVYFADWDLEFTNMEQRPHFCAISILALYSNFIENEGNVQNIFHKKEIQKLLIEANFELERQYVIDSRYLQDVQWEINWVKDIYPEIRKLPAKIQTIMYSYYEMMDTLNDKQSLNTFILCAK